MAADLHDLLTPAQSAEAAPPQQAYAAANGNGYQGQTPRAETTQLYLGVPGLNETDIRALISHHGTIRSISCKPEFSFVEMESIEQARSVIQEFDRKTVDLKDAAGGVRTINEFKVEFSRPRRDRSSRYGAPTRDDSKAGSTCYVCNKEGHWARDCPQSTRSNACYNCNQPGHRARDCPNPRSDSRRPASSSSSSSYDRDRDYRRDSYRERDYDRSYPPRDSRDYGGYDSSRDSRSSYGSSYPSTSYPPRDDYRDRDRGYSSSYRDRERSPPRDYDRGGYRGRSPSPVRSAYPPPATAYPPPPASTYPPATSYRDTRAPPATYPPATSAYPPPATAAAPYYRDPTPPAAAPYDPYAASKYDRRDAYPPAAPAASAYAPAASTYPTSYGAPPPATSSYPPRTASSSAAPPRRY